VESPSPATTDRTRLGRRFAVLWTAQTVSFLGSGTTLVAGPLLVASLTRDPLLISGAAFAQSLPWLLFSLVSGGLVDRLDRRRIMLVVDTVRAAALAVLAASVLADRVGVPLVYAVFFLLGSGDTLVRAAGGAVLPAVVPPHLLERANGRITASAMATSLVSGPLGGVLFTVAAALPFLLDAGSFAVAVVLLLFGLRGSFHGTPPGTGPRRTLAAEIGEGVRWMARHRLLRTLALLMGMLNVTLMAALSILVLLARERLGLNSVGYGLLFTAMAVGGLAGALVGERLIRWLGATVTLRGGLVVETLFHLVVATSRSPWAVGAAFAVFGVHGSLWGIVSTSLRQRLTPPAMLGRVGSTYLFVVAGGNAAGALLGGAVAGAFGLTAPYWVGFVVAALVTAVTWREFDRATIARAYATPPATADTPGGTADVPGAGPTAHDPVTPPLV
jgi:MFS family permease